MKGTRIGSGYMMVGYGSGGGIWIRIGGVYGYGFVMVYGDGLVMVYGDGLVADKRWW